METIRNFYQKAVYYTVSYGELAVWAVLIVLVLAFIFGGK